MRNFFLRKNLTVPFNKELVNGTVQPGNWFPQTPTTFFIIMLITAEYHSCINLELATDLLIDSVVFPV